MARPTKTPDQPRNKTAKFRVTEAELKRLEQIATEAGMSMSDLLRVQALSAEPIRTKATPDREALIRILGILGHVRNDLNKILQDRWSYKYVTPERAEQVFVTIEDMADQLHKALEA